MALLPLWVGAVPFGLVYAVAARAAGFSPVETQMMSLFLFSAAGQLAAVSLFAAGAPALVIGLTMLALNAHLVLLGLSVTRHNALGWPQRVIGAFFLTDGAYGVTVGRGQTEWPRLLGAGVSMYVVWNGATLLGSLVGEAAPNLAGLGVDFVVPLTFLAILAPIVRCRVDLLVVVVAAGVTLTLAAIGLGSLAVLTAGVVGSLTGYVAWRRGEGAAEARQAA